MNDADTIIEIIASRLRESSLRDLHGVMAKRKRDREDADLRRRTRVEQREEIAQWVLSFRSDKGNSTLALLRQVADGERQDFAYGPHVAAALYAGLLDLEVSIPFNTHMANVRTRYRLSLTEKGKERLTAAERAAALSDMAAADARAGLIGDPPEQTVPEP